MPSILSRTPPCPGSKSLVSFTLANRFKNEINKSPSWENKEIINVNRNNDRIL